MKLNKDQLAWLRTLESGKYRQTRGQLVNYGSYCCLGVACKLLGAKQKKRVFELNSNEYDCDLPDDYVARLGLHDSEGALVNAIEVDGFVICTLIGLNDTAEWTFKQIAEYIQANKENVFVMDT